MEKDLDYYMKLPYKIIIQPNLEGGYSAKLPELRICITCADTLEELFDMIENSKECWLRHMLDTKSIIPKPTILNKFKVFERVRVKSTGRKGTIVTILPLHNAKTAYFIEEDYTHALLDKVMEDDLEPLDMKYEKKFRLLCKSAI